MKALSLSCVKVTQNAKGLIKYFLGPFISRFGSGTENLSTMTGK